MATNFSKECWVGDDDVAEALAEDGELLGEVLNALGEYNERVTDEALQDAAEVLRKPGIDFVRRLAAQLDQEGGDA